MNNGVKATLGATAGLGATTVLHSLYPDQVESVLAHTVNYTDQILGGTGEFINEGANNLLTATTGSAAPFAGAMIPTVLAGAYGMKKLADVIGVEKKWLRTAMTIGGGAVGAGLTTTALAPYLVGGALAMSVSKPIYNLGKGALKYTGKGISGVYGGFTGLVGGIVKGAGKGAINGAKEGYKNPSIKPDLGF